MDDVPKHLGRYDILDVLGRGAQGVVVRAHDLVLDTPVALKLLHGDLVKDEQWMERVRREIVLARRIHHPSVARVHDMESSEGRTFLVMDLAPGRTLAALLQDCPRLPPAQAVQIARDAALALAAVHKAGVVHRDVKPQNLMIHDSGVRLVDFGIARAADMEPLTEVGAVIGTRRYMAPEVLLGAPATALSDVFALGVVLYEMLTGVRPFATGAQGDALQPMPPSAHGAPSGPLLDRTVLAAMAALPGRRTPSADALAESLSACAAELADAPPADAAQSLVADSAAGRREETVDTGVTTAVAAAADPGVAGLLRRRPRRMLVAAVALGVVGVAASVMRSSAPTPRTASPVAAQEGEHVDTAPTDPRPPPRGVSEPTALPPAPFPAPSPSPSVSPSPARRGTEPRVADGDARALEIAKRKALDRLQASARGRALDLGRVDAAQPHLAALRAAPALVAAAEAERQALDAVRTHVATAADVDAALTEANALYAGAGEGSRSAARPHLHAAADASLAQRYADALREVVAARNALMNP